MCPARAQRSTRVVGSYIADNSGSRDLELAAEQVEIPNELARVPDADGQPGNQRVPKVGHPTRGFQAMARHVTDGQERLAVGKGLGVVPVTTDLRGALGRKIPHQGLKAGEPKRLPRHRLDEVLELSSQPVLRDRRELPTTQLVV